jgi:hypothetical protein
MELKKLTEYQKFIILDSGEYILTSYQKIPYHFAFYTKHDLRCKARLASVGNWMIINIEDTHTAIFCMNAVKIGLFLGELYGTSSY